MLLWPLEWKLFSNFWNKHVTFGNFLEFLVKSYQVFYLLFCRVVILCSVMLFVGFSDCGFGVALPTLCILLDFSIFWLLFCGGHAIQEGSHSFCCLGWLGRKSSRLGRWQGAPLLLWLCIRMIPFQNLFIYTYFWKDACIGCSFSNTVILEWLYSTLILSR